MADDEVSIPVSIDAVRVVDEMQMARATYWVVVATAPVPGWTLAMAEGPQLHVLGEVGVVYRSTAADGRFSVEDIAALFDQIEADPSLSIETEDLWIPLAWLDPSREPERGDVYRVPLEAFHVAYRYRIQAITTAELRAAVPERPFGLSPDETEAFRAWARAQIEDARQRYPKDPDLALAWEES